MLLFYAPLEAYLTNTTEFWFDMKDVLPVTLVCFGVAFIAGMIINLILYAVFHKKHEKIYIALQLIVLGLFLGLYVQGTYIPREYGVLNGADIDWNAYPGYAAASIIVWLCAAAVAVVVGIKFRKHAFKVFLAAGCLVFLMESAALVSLLVGNDASENTIDDNIVVTDYGEFQLSSNRNIYVLVLDTFDANYMWDLLSDEDIDCEKILEDFTFYPNTAAGYPTTRASVPLILTGKWYENDVPFAEFINEAYEDDELTSTLTEEGYSIGAYTHPEFLSKAEGTYINVMNGEYHIGDYNEFCKNLYSLVMFEFMPHQLKSFFLVDTNSFDLCKETEQDETGSAAFTDSDADYYSYLSKYGFDITDSGNEFRFVHLYGMHGPFKYGADLIDNGTEYTYAEAEQGCLKEISALIDELKEEGVYDNTAIIIMADHGDPNMSYMSSNPLLLIKDFDEEKDFTISDAPVSYDDMCDAFQLLATEGSLDNVAWNDRDADSARRFLFYNWDDSWNEKYLPTMTEYMLYGSFPYGIEYNPTGNVFIPGMEQIESGKGYTLKAITYDDIEASEYSFIDIPINGDSEDFTNLYVCGLGDLEEGSNGKGAAWSEGYYTCFKILPDGEFLLPYQFNVFFDATNKTADSYQQYAYAEVNNQRVSSILTDNCLSVELSVDELNSDEITIIIFYPYAAPLEEGGKDVALHITGIEICPKYSDSQQGFLEYVHEDQELNMDFAYDSKLYRVRFEGWIGQEAGGMWSGPSSTVTFWAKNDKDLLIDIDCGKLSQDVISSLYVNGNFVCDINEGTQTVTIPAEYLSELEQTIEFSTPYAVTPAAIGLNPDDGRVLGLHVFKINISVVDGDHN